MRKILLVEDDDNLRQQLGNLLRQQGFDLLEASSIQAARDQAKSQPDLVILDWALPDGEGIQYLQELRSQGFKAPIIMLTARAGVMDKVAGLDFGANDYVAKPYEPLEILARIRAQLRLSPTQGAHADVVGSGGVEMNLKTREAKWRGRKLELTRKEFDLLKLLCESPGQVFTRDELLNKIWGFENFPSTRTVDTHVLQLRQKTKDDLIETVRGIGYRLRKDSE